MADLNGYSKRSNRKYETILAFIERFHDIRNIDANPKNLLTECGFTFMPAEADRCQGHDKDRHIKMLLCCIRRELGGPG